MSSDARYSESVINMLFLCEKDANTEVAIRLVELGHDADRAQQDVIREARKHARDLASFAEKVEAGWSYPAPSASDVPRLAAILHEKVLGPCGSSTGLPGAAR